jgi:hypothetical protein
VTRKTRKLIGATFLLVFVPLYALVVMAIGDIRMPGSSVLVQTIYFTAAGLLWVIPAGLVISWMQRPDRDQS